ncbi:MAG: hypothetical protein AB1453_01635 [Chloroflexota bacterium]
MKSRIAISLGILLGLFCLGSLVLVGLTAGIVWQNASGLPGFTPAEPGATPLPLNQPTSPTPPAGGAAPAEAVPADQPTGTPIPVVEDAEILRQMDEIEAQVAALRGLEERQPVERRLMNSEALRQHVEKVFLQDYSLEEAQQDVKVLAVFGLLEKEYDLYNLYLDLYSEQVAGFYDSEAKVMYVVQANGFGGVERSTYAHEYTHALQDQTYDLREGLHLNPEYCRENSEYCAALTALIEGDASLTEQYWLYLHGSEQDNRDIEEFYSMYASPVLDNAPAFLQEDFAFPYREGVEFVLGLFQEGGFAAVDAAYANPPVTTEMILHPQKYPQDLPTPIELPDFTNWPQRRLTELDRGVMGEWYTYLILGYGSDPVWRLSTTQASQAAAGWQGDAYWVAWDDETRMPLMALLTEWESEQDAREFSNAFSGYGRLRWGTADESSQTDSQTWSETADGVVSFARQGTRTLWLIAPRSADIQRLAPAMTALTGGQ